jgi:hypothetical protein
MEGDANKLVPVYRAENASLLLAEGVRDDWNPQILLKGKLRGCGQSRYPINWADT